MLLKKKSVYFSFTLILCIMVFMSACSESKSVQSGGKTATQGVTDETITIGNWATQSGPAAFYGDIARGVDAYLKHINDKGGINGRKFKLITYDEEYQPSRAVSVGRKLIEEDKVFAIVGNDCTSCNKAALPLFKKSGIPIVGISTGADLFVNPVIPNVFGLLTNYGVEGRIFVNYALDELKAKNIGIFYQNDDFGKSGYLAAIDELKKRGVKPVAEIPYNANDVDYNSAALKMQEAKPDVILSFSITKPSAAFKKELYKLGVDIPFIVAGVTGADNRMFEIAGDAWTNVYSSSWLTLVSENDQKIQEYVAALKKYYPDVNPTGPAQWGWAEAEVLVEGIRRAGKDVTPENVIKQLETLKNWNEGMALNVTYSPKNHYGSTSVFIIKDKDGKMVKHSDVITHEVE
jgi:branched-chain amino acid transport system substrate-binding protein